MSGQSFRIRVPLNTSLRLGRLPVSLDGLLWHCLFLKTGDPDRAREALSALLSQDQGVYRASALRFGVYPGGKTLIATQTPMVGVMREHDLLKEQFHPTGRKGAYTRLVVNGGPFKNRLNKYETYHAPELTWDAVGNDPDQVCRLLNFYVQAVGFEANRGFGSVGSFRWESLPEDTSWLDEEGQAARVLPVPLWEQVSGEPSDTVQTIMAQTTPPYWGESDTLCVAPPRVRRIQLKESVY